VAYAHSYTSYSLGNRNLITSLLDRGYAVYAIDHRGHGFSEGRRASLDRFDDLVDDFDLLVGTARLDFPDRQLFTMGFSMGGLIVLRHAMASPKSVSGVVAGSPALVVGVKAAPWKIRLLGKLSHVVPNLPVIRGRRARDGADPALERLIARNLYVYHGRTRLNLAREIYSNGLDAIARAAEFTAPLLIQHGAEDDVAFPVGARHFFDAASSPDKRLDWIPDRGHGIYSEPGHEEVVASAIDWLDDHVCLCPTTS
jgi:acylglycerol lipase